MQRLQRILSLADVEDARLRLAALELRNPLMGAPALAQALQVRGTLPVLVRSLRVAWAGCYAFELQAPRGWQPLGTHRPAGLPVVQGA